MVASHLPLPEYFRAFNHDEPIRTLCRPFLHGQSLWDVPPSLLPGLTLLLEVIYSAGSIQRIHEVEMAIFEGYLRNVSRFLHPMEGLVGRLRLLTFKNL